MASRKKVIVRQFDGRMTAGYAPLAELVSGQSVELLDITGKVISLPLNNIKLIAYVKDFNLDDPVDPERLGRRSFPGKPRGRGLWLQLQFKDGDALEGVAHPDLSLLEVARSDGGLVITPPDTLANTHKVFVPLSALKDMQAVALLGGRSAKARTSPVVSTDQGALFEK